MGVTFWSPAPGGTNPSENGYPPGLLPQEHHWVREAQEYPPCILLPYYLPQNGSHI